LLSQYEATAAIAADPRGVLFGNGNRGDIELGAEVAATFSSKFNKF